MEALAVVVEEDVAVLVAAPDDVLEPSGDMQVFWVRRASCWRTRWGYTRIQGALYNLRHAVGRGIYAHVMPSFASAVDRMKTKAGREVAGTLESLQQRPTITMDASEDGTPCSSSRSRRFNSEIGTTPKSI